MDGLADKEVAQRLGLGLETVRSHVKNVYHKLHVSGRIELLSRAARGQLSAGQKQSRAPTRERLDSPFPFFPSQPKISCTP